MVLSDNNMNLQNPYNHDFWDGNRRSFRPWFDNRADYNTNAASYYDYLAHLGEYLDWIIKYINDLYRRDINVKETSTVTMVKEGEWIDPKQCCGTDPHEHDIEILSAIVRVSKDTLNAIKVHSDGLYAKDLQPDVDQLYQDVKNIYADLEALKKLLINLESGGFWTRHDPNNIFNGDLTPALFLMMGDMNISSVQRGVTRSVRSNLNGFDNNDLRGRL